MLGGAGGLGGLGPSRVQAIETPAQPRLGNRIWGSRWPGKRTSRCLICLLPPHQEEPLPCRLGSAFLCRLPGRPSPVVWAASYTSFSLAAPAERH